MLWCCRIIICAKAIRFQNLCSGSFSQSSFSERKAIGFGCYKPQTLGYSKVPASVLQTVGLPCGTCSRAREKLLPSHLNEYSAPQPLREEWHLARKDYHTYQALTFLRCRLLTRFTKLPLNCLKFVVNWEFAYLSKTCSEAGCGCSWQNISKRQTTSN